MAHLSSCTPCDGLTPPSRFTNNSQQSATMNAPLPPEIAGLLQDEAYAVLCRESLTEELAKIQTNKARILTTRPPFGMLASNETVTVFRKSMRAVEDNEAGLQGRLDQIAQIDTWLKEDIDKALQNYLPSGSKDYRICREATAVVTSWEHAVQALHELAVALARDAHTLYVTVKGGTASHVKPALVQQTRQRAINNLRTSVLAIQTGVTAVQEVRQEFVRLCDTQADGLQLPEPPPFRDDMWVDRLSKLSDGQLCAEASVCESEARAFCATGMTGLLREGGEVHEACIDAGRAILAKYWRQLRVHAQSHYVKEREVDDVLAELNKHRLAAEAKRAQANFETATVASLR